MKYYLTIILLSAYNVFAGAEPTEAQHVETTTTNYFSALQSSVEQVRVEAIKNALPTEQEIGLIWTDAAQAERATQVVQSWVKKFVAKNKRAHAEMKQAGKLNRVSAEDYRSVKTDVVTKVIPQSIPLYIVNLEYDKGDIRYYAAVVNGRVILIDNLKAICQAVDKK